jgi:hypothetical protein
MNLFQLETSLGMIIKESACEDIEEYYKKYLRLLYKNKKFTLLLEEARKMHLLYPKSVSSLEWICKVYSEQIAQGVEVLDVSENNFEECYKKLEVLNSGSSLVLLAKGALLFRNKSFVEARDALTQGTMCFVKIIQLNPSMLLCLATSLDPLIYL